MKNDLPDEYYVTTPAVAHDLLTFIEAEVELAGQAPADSKLWCYGISYGIMVAETSWAEWTLSSANFRTIRFLLAESKPETSEQWLPIQT